MDSILHVGAVARTGVQPGRLDGHGVEAHAHPKACQQRDDEEKLAGWRSLIVWGTGNPKKEIKAKRREQGSALLTLD